MSRSAPRKTRHSRNPSTNIPGASDYESDAAVVISQYHPPPAHRSNTELNLAVLQRYLPSIHTILSIAANAVVYIFDPNSQQWEKSSVEGTLFVCAQAPLPDDAANRPRACVFLLNRRGLDNLIVDLVTVSQVEVTSELIIVNIEQEAEGQGAVEQVLGLWIHQDKDETREVNGAIILESWKFARQSNATEATKVEAGPALQAVGRRLSISEMFAKHGGVGIS